MPTITVTKGNKTQQRQPGLSHITVLAHDPPSSGTTTPVPEPGVLWLMGFGWIGLAGFVRINARRKVSSSMPH
ncbi:PEP-CTERM sorting domain-containing protein [Halochromatium glycolicum]